MQPLLAYTQTTRRRNDHTTSSNVEPGTVGIVAASTNITGKSFAQHMEKICNKFASKCRGKSKPQPVRTIEYADEIFQIAALDLDDSQCVTVKLESGNHIRFRGVGKGGAEGGSCPPTFLTRVCPPTFMPE